MIETNKLGGQGARENIGEHENRKTPWDSPVEQRTTERATTCNTQRNENSTLTTSRKNDRRDRNKEN